MSSCAVRAMARPVAEGARRRQRRNSARDCEVPFDPSAGYAAARFRQFVGWEMHHNVTHETVGVIEEVVCLEEQESQTWPSYFRVLQEGQPPARHFIPIVSELIPALRPKQRHVLLSPPPGLLELGWNRAKIDALRIKLKPYAQPKDRTQPWWRLEMPNVTLLEDEGRVDLIKEIHNLGGFAHVATLLGWKCNRKPWGYWDDMDTLDKEICYFIAASWIEAQGLDGSYYYNTVTQKIRWDEPVVPDMVHGLPQPIVVEADERIMPTQTSVMNSRRWDMHHAINYHGGYRSVALELERTPCRRVTRPLHEIAPSLDIIHHFLEAHDMSSLPYLTVLKSYGEPAVVEAVKAVGGIRSASRILDIPCDYQPRPFAKRRGPSAQKWASIDEAVDHIVAFQYTEGCPGHFPTQHELINAYRYDLKYAIEKFGRTRIKTQLEATHSH